MICQDKRPFYMVEEGFKNLLKELAPSFKAPSAFYMKEQLELKHQSVSSNVKQRILNAPHISFSMEVGPETMSKKAYFGITAHFLKGTSILFVDLSIVQLSSNHTADSLERTMLQVFEEWQVEKERF